MLWQECWISGHPWKNFNKAYHPSSSNWDEMGHDNIATSWQQQFLLHPHIHTHVCILVYTNIFRLYKKMRSFLSYGNKNYLLRLFSLPSWHFFLFIGIDVVVGFTMRMVFFTQLWHLQFFFQQFASKCRWRDTKYPAVIFFLP